MPRTPVLVMTALLATSVGFGESTRLEDQVDVLQVGERVLAVSARTGRTVVANLQLRERVIGLASQGLVGIAVTDRRLLAVHDDSLRWLELPLRREERDVPPRSSDVLVADRFVVVTLPKRIVAFSARRGVWSELKLTPAERVEQRVLDQAVVALVTNRRAIGFAARQGFSTARLRVDEGTPRVSSEDRSVTLVTEQRVLVFTSAAGGWQEIQRTLRF